MCVSFIYRNRIAPSGDSGGETEAADVQSQEKKIKRISYLKEFCSDTTMHGIRYFTEKHRHWLERLSLYPNHLATSLQIVTYN